MHDLSLVFLAGLLGSAHCMGMCGPFVLAIGTTGDKATVAIHQSLYLLGKTVTYVVLGALAGAFGSALMHLNGVQRGVSIVAGAVMLIVGLGLVGLYRRVDGATFLTRVPVFRNLMGYFLKNHTPASSMGLGALTGFLPCGLVYALLAKAAATGTLLSGATTMLVFGAATIPALFLLGMTGSLLNPGWRQKLNLVGGVVVIVLGMLTVVRGTPLIQDVMSVFPSGTHSGHHEMVH